MTNAAPIDGAMRVYVRHLHPLIAKGCVPLFRNRHYAQAVEECAKAVFHHLREKTGIDKDGVNLAEEVFGDKNPVLALSDLKTESKRNEQVDCVARWSSDERPVWRLGVLGARAKRSD